MKWKERGMVFMKTINKNYFRYLIKKNKYFLLIIWIFSVISMPCYTITFKNNYQWTNFSLISSIASVLGLFLSFIVPIYLFAFIQRKQSTIMYLALPIKKESLFLTTSLFSVFATAVPVMICYLISVSIKNYFMPLSAGYNFLSAIVLLIYMLSLQAIITTIILLCQNMLDTIIVSIAFMIIPFLFYYTFFIYMSKLILNMMLGIGSYIQVFAPIINYLSCVYSGILQVSYFINNIPLISYAQIIYWLIIGMIFYVLAFHLFKKRTIEQCEKHTKSIFIYPILIAVILLSVMMAAYHNEINIYTIILYAIFFILFMLMYFFAKRKVCLTWKIPVIYIMFIICCVGFANIFEKTNGFGFITELPKIDTPSYFQLTISSSRPVTFRDQTVNHFMIQGPNEYTAQLIYDFHKKIIDKQIIIPVRETGILDSTSNIVIFYDNNLGIPSIYRDYQLINSKQIIEIVKLYDELLTTIESDSKYHCNHWEALVEE